MRTHAIPLSILKRKSPEIIPNLQLWDFSKGPENKFETAVVYELSLFKPLKFYCIIWRPEVLPSIFIFVTALAWSSFYALFSFVF